MTRMVDSDNIIRQPPDFNMTDSFVAETQFTNATQDEDMPGTDIVVDNLMNAPPSGCDNLGANQSLVNGLSPMEL